MPSYSRKVEIPGRKAEEIYESIASGIDRFLEKASLPVKMEVQRDPVKKQVSISSNLFSAALNCRESCVEVDAKLSLMAAPFKSKIDEGIDKWLAKAFPRT